MKKTYIIPQLEVCQIHQSEALMVISDPTRTTGAEGLGVSTESYEEVGRVKGQGGYNVWDDDWSR